MDEEAFELTRFQKGCLAASLVFVAFVGITVLWGLYSTVVLASRFDTRFPELLAPDRAHVLAGEEIDHGGLGGETLVVVRSRDGKWRRTVASGDWGARPPLKWIDARTVLVGDHKLDIFKSPQYDFSGLWHDD